MSEYMSRKEVRKIILNFHKKEGCTSFYGYAEHLLSELGYPEEECTNE